MNDSPLLALPGELRNTIYEHLRAIIVHTLFISDKNSKLLLPAALSSVCRQLRHEFEAIYLEVPPALVLHVTLLNEDFSCPERICTSAHELLAADSVDRTTLFQVTIRDDAVAAENLHDFIQTLSISNGSKNSRISELGEDDDRPTALVETFNYEIVVHRSVSKLVNLRQNFARMHRRYQTSVAASETEQVVFGLVYRAFADAAYKVDTICGRDFALGCWRWGDGGWGFI